MTQRTDDLSCDPRKWSLAKLIVEKRNGMPAVLLEWDRRCSNVGQ